ncbi:MAG: hypothetical protein JWO51_2485 [Rhodospirillales bacterium]|nr:hypothetical protein [Rhodospirillales bacterium]
MNHLDGLACRLDHGVDRDAEFRIDIADLAGCAELMHSDEATIEA